MPNVCIGNHLAALTLDLQWTRMEPMSGWVLRVRQYENVQCAHPQ